MRTATTIRTPTATHFYWIVTFGANNWFGTVKMHVNILTTMENRSINVFVHLIRSVTSLVLVMTIWLDIHHFGITLVMCSFIIWFRRRFIHSIAYMPEGESIVLFFSFLAFGRSVSINVNTLWTFNSLVLFMKFCLSHCFPYCLRIFWLWLDCRFFYFISFFYQIQDL